MTSSYEAGGRTGWAEKMMNRAKNITEPYHAYAPHKDNPLSLRAKRSNLGGWAGNGNTGTNALHHDPTEIATALRASQRQKGECLAMTPKLAVLNFNLSF